jgi:signal transduction histidine kinase
VDNHIRVLFVSASTADATVLTQLIKRDAGTDAVSITTVAEAQTFFSAVASEHSYHAIVIDERVDWLAWHSIADECCRLRPSAVLILLVSADRQDVHEQIVERHVSAVYPRNSAGLIAMASLLTRIADQRQHFSLRLETDAAATDTEERIDEERQKLVYAVSHDLQDPLQLARRYADILDEDYQQSLGDTGGKVLGHLQYNLGRTQEMLDELLDYSRLQRSQPDVEAVDFNKLLDEVVSMYKVTLDDIGGRVVRQQTLPTLMVDRRQFQRVLQNLIGNAIKFRSQQPLEVSVRAQQVHQEWRIGIKDNGIGVREGDAERIFDMFERGSMVEDAPGTGMGLAICKRIVQNHGGKLWVKSAPGDGSVFIFSVPQPDNASGIDGP